MVMVYQKLFFPVNASPCSSLLVLARPCPSCQSMLVRPERNHCVIALNRALAQAIPQEHKLFNVSKARKESLCDSSQ